MEKAEGFKGEVGSRRIFLVLPYIMLWLCLTLYFGSPEDEVEKAEGFKGEVGSRRTFLVLSYIIIWFRLTL